MYFQMQWVSSECYLPSNKCQTDTVSCWVSDKHSKEFSCWRTWYFPQDWAETKLAQHSLSGHKHDFKQTQMFLCSCCVCQWSKCLPFKLCKVIMRQCCVSNLFRCPWVSKNQCNISINYSYQNGQSSHLYDTTTARWHLLDCIKL